MRAMKRRRGCSGCATGVEAAAERRATRWLSGTVAEVQCGAIQVLLEPHEELAHLVGLAQFGEGLVEGLVPQAQQR